MRDLRPYVCTTQDCDHSTESFPSVNQYLKHVIISHELQPSERFSTCAFEGRKEKSVMCIFCGERTDAGKGDNARGRHVARHMEEIAFTVVPKAYEKWDFYSESSTNNSSLSERNKSVFSNRKFPARGAKGKSSGKARTPLRRATDDDAKKHGIPAGYSLENWDPEKKPILLVGSVFDAKSLGKWIYDWTVFYHGPQSPICDIAKDLWLLLVELAATMAELERKVSWITNINDQEILEDFISSGERLWVKWADLLRICEEDMLKAEGRKEGEKTLREKSGCEFIETMFGRGLETTEAFMQSIRLWGFSYLSSLCLEAF